MNGRSFRSWRPVLADGALAAFLFVIGLESWLHPEHLPMLPVVAGLTLPLAVRRRFPVPVFAIVAASAFGQWLIISDRVRTYDLGVLVALYTVAAYARRRWSLLALGIGLLGCGLAWLGAHNARGINVLGLIPAAASVVAIWMLGRSLRARRRYLAELEQRAVRLERERDALARAAVAEERARIAREMHDVVAHTVAVMVAQAEGASVVVRTAPDAAERALGVISDSGRSALAELRRMLGVLRQSAGPDPIEAVTAPQPGLGDLDELVASMRMSGLPVRFVREGSEAPVEPTLGLAVYRIVQESLTNTLKHAGPQTPTEVLLRRTVQGVELEIRDQGAGHELGAGRSPGRPPAGRPPAGSAGGGDPVGSGDGSGHGLTGMRERVAVHGGRFAAGPTPSGGWRVHAYLPLLAVAS